MQFPKVSPHTISIHHLNTDAFFRPANYSLVIFFISTMSICFYSCLWIYTRLVSELHSLRTPVRNRKRIGVKNNKHLTVGIPPIQPQHQKIYIFKSQLLSHHLANSSFREQRYLAHLMLFIATPPQNQPPKHFHWARYLLKIIKNSKQTPALSVSLT
jgi:hypothetical protein